VFQLGVTVRSSFDSEHGSILFEFIAFVLLGQLFIFGATMTILGELDQKLKVDLFAHQLARAGAIGNLDSLLVSLQNDYQLSQVKLIEVPCNQQLFCLEVVADSRTALGVSLRHAE
jgi:hypothetical protein